MAHRLTILHKGLILIAVPLFFQIAFIGIVAKMRKEGSYAVEWTIHSKDVIAQAQRCRAKLLSAHGSIQGFILTKDPSYQESLKTSTGQVPDELNTLRSLVVDNQEQTHSAAIIATKANEFLRFMNEGLEIARSGRMDAKTASDRRQQSQTILDELETDFERFLDEEIQLDKDRHQKMNRVRSTLDRFIAVGLATSILVTVALSVLYSRNISGRIANLTVNAHRLSNGEELTPPIAGGDEIARLDQVFHEMAQTLAESARRERGHVTLLESRAEELALVNGQLREKAQENEMFVYSVSHDLRSPLVNLQGFSKELGLIGQDLSKLVSKDEVPPQIQAQARALIDTEMKESIGFIQTAVTRLSSIIDALLRLSRVGRVEYRRQPVDVDAIVSRVVTALRGTILERSATIEVGELPPAWGDPTAVEQVFANLIGNALNYLDRTRSGRIEVFAIESSKPIEGVPTGSVVYAVRDNGLGIADSYKSKIFTAFQRLHGDVAKGEGVGLALVRRMVERHGGRVWFESESGLGTTFFVALPVEPDPERSDEQTSQASTETLNGRANECQPSR